MVKINSKKYKEGTRKVQGKNDKRVKIRGLPSKLFIIKFQGKARTP